MKRFLSSFELLIHVTNQKDEAMIIVSERHQGENYR